MKAKAAAVEPTGRMFETERLIFLYRVAVLLKSLQRMTSKLMQKQFLTLASLTLHKAKQCSEFLLSLLSTPKTMKVIINYSV